MALTPPETLSPSKVSSFKDCALAFRFSAIDRLPEEPSAAATKGTLVHLALEHLFERPATERTLDAALADLTRATEEMRTDPDFAGLDLDAAAETALLQDADALVRRYLTMEDPSQINPIGLELRLEAKVGDLRIRGIIDRLELDGPGRLVVTDYKSGKAPGQAYQQGRLGGVTFYALLCEELFGTLPVRIQLLYLGDGTIISTEPTTAATQALRKKIGALWSAVESACARDNFAPRPGPLCNWCSFHAYCPAQGGDPALASEFVAAREAEAAAAT